MNNLTTKQVAVGVLVLAGATLIVAFGGAYAHKRISDLQKRVTALEGTAIPSAPVMKPGGEITGNKKGKIDVGQEI